MSTAILSGPTSGVVYSNLIYTVSLDTPFSGTVALTSSNNQGILTPLFLSYNNSSSQQSFIFTPTAAGSYSISISSPNKSLNISGSPVSLTVTAQQATSLTLTGPAPTDYAGSIIANVNSPTNVFTVIPNGLFTGIVNMSDLSVSLGTIAGGTFSPSQLVFNNSSNPQTFNYTPASVGTQFIHINSLPTLTKSNGIQILTLPSIGGTGPMSGTVNPGTTNQVAVYLSNGTAVTGENLSTLIDAVIGGTQGDIPFRGVATWGVLPPGTANQFLQTGGAGANPSWATPAAANISGLAASATTDTTNATNITTGTLAAAQLPALTGAVTSTAGSSTTAFGTIPTLNMLANATGGTAVPSPNTLTSFLDSVFGTTINGIITRGASIWSAASNLILPSAGPVRFAGGAFVNVVGPGTLITNTTTQTSIFTGATLRSGQTRTIPAGVLIAGQAIRVSVWGFFSCTTSTPSMTVSLMLGSTLIGQGLASMAAAGAANGEFFTGTQIEILFPTVGSSGSAAIRGSVIFVESVSPVTQTGVSIFQGANTGAGVPTTVNTTIALPVDVQFTWGTASTSNSFQLLGGYMELIG